MTGLSMLFQNDPVARMKKKTKTTNHTCVHAKDIITSMLCCNTMFNKCTEISSVFLPLDSFYATKIYHVI